MIMRSHPARASKAGVLPRKGAGSRLIALSQHDPEEVLLFRTKIMRRNESMTPKASGRTFRLNSCAKGKA
jgi:hypothetical protein